MKVIFEDFTNFFQLPSQRGHRCGQPDQHALQTPGQPQGHREKHGTAPQQPGGAPQPHAHGIVAPHGPGALLQGHPQQGPADPQPEADVQHQPHPRPGEAAAGHPEQVIDQPCPQPKGQAHHQAPDL